MTDSLFWIFMVTVSSAVCFSFPGAVCTPDCFRCLGIGVCQETHEVKLNLWPWMSQKPRPLDMQQKWIKAQKLILECHRNGKFPEQSQSELLWPFMSRVLKCQEIKLCLFSFSRWWCQHCRIFFFTLKLLLFMWIFFFSFCLFHYMDTFLCFALKFVLSIKFLKVLHLSFLSFAVSDTKSGYTVQSPSKHLGIPLIWHSVACSSL